MCDVVKDPWLRLFQIRTFILSMGHYALLPWSKWVGLDWQPYLTVPSDDSAIWEQVVGHAADRMLDAQTEAVFSGLQAGIVVFRLWPTKY